MAALADKIAALLPQAEGNPTAMLHLARMLRQDGRLEEALILCRRALALAPGDPKLTAQANAFLSDDVPPWHFGIVRDDARNAAYDAALRRAVRPHSRVLEIGTGTGLLAMIAARAGAAEVITCEKTPVIAQMATEIVARNGYSDRVRVIAKHSDKLDVEADLGRPADILVSEIVSNDLLGEGVLPAHERAVRNLLKPGGRVIPARGRIRVALAEDGRDGQERLGEIDGFDLSPFNKFTPPVRQIRVGHERLQLRGDPADLFTFDFAASRFCAPAHASVVCRAKGGRVNGIAQWIALHMDQETHYENRPAPGASSCWAVLFHPLPRPIYAVPGQEIRVFGAHDRHRVSLWSDAGVLKCGDCTHM
jgi:type II protein arginine methyltransferase